MSEGSKKTLLILGGTGEAAALAAKADALWGERVRIINSLAGRVEEPAALAGEVRIGGFGGAAALALYLKEQKVDAVIDATHPFAMKISAHAREACDAAKIPRLVFVRPPWTRKAGDRWVEVPDFSSAAEALPWVGRRIFLTIGHKGLESFSHLHGPEHPNMWFLLRFVSLPQMPLPLGEPGRNYEIIQDRGPFSLEEECRLMSGNQINVLVSKASGGEATSAKIMAARKLKLPVVLISRPNPERGEKTSDPGEVISWLGEKLSLVGAAAPRRA